jgi:hypothetical protein
MPTTSFILFNLSKDQSVLQAISAPEKLLENATDCNLKSLEPLKVTAKVSFVKNKKDKIKERINKIIFVFFIEMNF